MIKNRLDFCSINETVENMISRISEKFHRSVVLSYVIGGSCGWLEKTSIFALSAPTGPPPRRRLSLSLLREGPLYPPSLGASSPAGIDLSSTGNPLLRSRSRFWRELPPPFSINFLPPLCGRICSFLLWHFYDRARKKAKKKTRREEGKGGTNTNGRNCAEDKAGFVLLSACVVICPAPL